MSSSLARVRAFQPPARRAAAALVWLAAAASPFLALHQAHAADMAGFNLTIAETSNYIFRGISQSDNHAALQGSLEFHVPFGLYAGVWASTIDFNDAPTNSRSEVDYYGGYRVSLGKWSLDFGGMYYAYPDGKSSYRFAEYYGKVAYPVSDTLSWNGQAIYSPDFFGENSHGTYFQTGLANQFMDWLSGDANIGRQSAKDLDDTANSGFPYNTWNAGVTMTYSKLALDLRYSDASLSKAECLASAGNAKWCGAKFMATITLKLP